MEREYVIEKLGEGAFDGVELGGSTEYEALNFVDGERSVLDIAQAVSAEYGPLDPQMVYAFFKVLGRAELLQFK
jgi:hypothetical protein